jgi:hypothetical protein
MCSYILPKTTLETFIKKQRKILNMMRFGLGPSKVSYNSPAGYTIFEHFMYKISCLATKIVILGSLADNCCKTAKFYNVIDFGDFLSDIFYKENITNINSSLYYNICPYSYDPRGPFTMPVRSLFLDAIRGDNYMKISFLQANFLSLNVLNIVDFFLYILYICK